MGTDIENGWFKVNEHSGEMFSEAFAWHWHNTSNKDYTPEPGSKFARWEEVIDNKLTKMGI